VNQRITNQVKTDYEEKRKKLNKQEKEILMRDLANKKKY